MRVPQQSAKELRRGADLERGRADLCLRKRQGNLQELRFGDTPEARHLRQLLEREGAAAARPRVLQHRMILVGGGATVSIGRRPPSSQRSGNVRLAAPAVRRLKPGRESPRHRIALGRGPSGHPDGTQTSGSRKQELRADIGLSESGRLTQVG